MIRRTVLALVALGLAAVPVPIVAHETRPGLLDLRETAPNVYAFFWKRPAGGEVEIDLVPVFPDGCRRVGLDQRERVPDALVIRGTLDCDGGLRGKTLSIGGLASTLTDVIVRIRHGDGTAEDHLLKPAMPSVTLGAAADRWQRSWIYFRLGIEHFLLGIDHVLFVLGLLFVVAGWRMLVRTITSFTIAHSITLAMATFGIASVPVAPLNATIALSILFLGAEIVRRRRGESSLTLRHPWIVAFAFGLLHGFGFASGLASIGLPRSEIPLALLLFNLGVEAAQIAFVGLALWLAYAFRRLEIAWPRLIEASPAYLVGSLGAFWTIQRTVAMVIGSVR